MTIYDKKKSGARRVMRGFLHAVLVSLLALALAGCVDQHPPEGASAVPSAAAAASGAGAGAAETPPEPSLRVVATSMATVEIADRLGIDLIGIPHSDLARPPARYEGLPEIGMPMAPDIELIRSMGPDIVLSPISLAPDLRPKYEAAGLEHYFLDLRSVDGMYGSIAELGAMFGREGEASAMVSEYEGFVAGYAAAHEGMASPRVLVLMGLPGSYIVATEHSYAGSLVKLAGGANVYAGEEEEFIAANTEDMALRDPDVILRAAHALPEDVVEMFAEEFAANDVWKHFRAVKEGRVYDLPYGEFGMSANFSYPQALVTLDAMLYGGGGA